MAKMWQGRTDGVLSKEADDFNSSISFDSKMFKQDILGSVAHAKMLGETGIIPSADAETIADGLLNILDDLISGALKFNMEAEDIHMFVEEELTARIGEVGKKLHTARSRNDQVALDLRMYLKDENAEIKSLLLSLIKVISEKASENTATIMPGYTHLQRAQPITFAGHLLAYAQMFKRDYSRLVDATSRMNYSPLGSCALAGTTYPTNRFSVAEKLGFLGITENSRFFCKKHTFSTCKISREYILLQGEIAHISLVAK